jgi:glycosyltransferase involved in cell wall biosynthesis
MWLSVITVCYNNLSGLVRTYASLKYDLQEFEWVIVDGGSSDGTVDFVEEEIRPTGCSLVFISDQDKGIYDAMNKGITKATGEFAIFLNAGDTLEYSIKNLLTMQNSLSDINVFSIKKIDQYNKHVKWNGLGRSPEMLYRVPIPHQGSIIRKSLFSEIGLYDLTYRLLSDHDFFSKAFRNGYEYKFFNDIVLAAFYLDGVSSHLKQSLVLLAELEDLQLKNFGIHLPLDIRIRYYFKYFLSFLPLSGRAMAFSRRIFFKRYL